MLGVGCGRREQGRSSDMEEILGTSNRVAVMHEGAVTGILDRNQCSEEAIMRLAVG